jgi:hypothetical protein
MATIGNVTLTITPVLNSNDVFVQIGYRVFPSSHDMATEQHYREVCELIGDDTPGDGTDDVIKIDPPLFDGTTVFTSGGNDFTRAISRRVARSLLDEDNNGLLLQEDEIRARVTLTPIPTSRESNLIRMGGPVLEG